MSWIEEFLGMKYTDLNQFLLRIGTNILAAIVIVIVGFWLAKMISKGLIRVLRKSNTDEGLITFSTSFISLVLKILVVVTAITQLGIEMTSFVAILGAAGLAIGMAFSGTLSNFAGGIMILVLKPFKVGDTVLIQTQKGVVKEIQIFNTYIYTADNKVIILPNGPVANGNIINFTKEGKRRNDWTITLAYGQDFDVVREKIQKILSEEKRIIMDKGTFVGITALSSNGMEILVWAWSKTSDCTAVQHDINERIYKEFSNSNILFPVPQS
jgi:small conductance mechanosensitive channel